MYQCWNIFQHDTLEYNYGKYEAIFQRVLLEYNYGKYDALFQRVLLESSFFKQFQRLSSE